MCTLTWLQSEAALRIFFNRDEKLTRLPATPPLIKTIQGVQVLAPVDGNSGGAWLTVNAFGLAVAVLNYYEAEKTMPAKDASFESRGHLVLKLAPAVSLSSVMGVIKSMALIRYRPFLLAVFHGEADGILIRWDGNNLEQYSLSEVSIPVTTSSFQTQEVLQCRTAMFDQIRTTCGSVSTEMLEKFHHSRDSRGGAYSVTMTRSDAMTVSFSSVTIGKRSVSFYYQPRLTDGVDPDYLSGESVTINRA